MLQPWGGGSWPLPRGRLLRPSMEGTGASCFFLGTHEEELVCILESELYRMNLGIHVVLWMCLLFVIPNPSIKSCSNTWTNVFSNRNVSHSGLFSAKSLRKSGNYKKTSYKKIVSLYGSGQVGCIDPISRRGAFPISCQAAWNSGRVGDREPQDSTSVAVVWSGQLCSC